MQWELAPEITMEGCMEVHLVTAFEYNRVLDGPTLLHLRQDIPTETYRRLDFYTDCTRYTDFVYGSRLERLKRRYKHSGYVFPETEQFP